MFLEKITPTVFGMLIMGVFAVVAYLLRDRLRKYSPNQWKGWQVLLFFLSPILLFVLFSVVRYQVVYAPRFAQFDAYMDEYTSVSAQKPGEWVMPGKILPIDTQTNKVDVRIYYELPDDLRPLIPDEVRMLLWLDCDQRNVGTYSHGGGAMQWYCMVSLVDMDARGIIGEQLFTGSEPPLTNPGSGDQSGSFPSDKIIQYLQTLPEK